MRKRETESIEKEGDREDKKAKRKRKRDLEREKERDKRILFFLAFSIFSILNRNALRMSQAFFVFL